MANLMDKYRFHRRGTVGDALADLALDVATGAADAAEIILEPIYSAVPRPPSTQLGGLTKLVFEVAVASGGEALSDFAVLGKAHQNGGWHSLLAAWPGEGELPMVVINQVGAVKTVAAGARALLYMDLGPLYAIKFQAKTASGTAVVDALGSLYR